MRKSRFMKEQVSKMPRTVLLSFGLILTLVVAGWIGCDMGPQSQNGMKELQEGQKKILERLEGLEKSQKEILAAAKKPTRGRRQIDYDKVYDIAPGKSAKRGAEDAKVTLVEFSDYQCPYSKRAQPLINQLLEAFPDDLQHVFKNFPLNFHKRAAPSAKACTAAGMQGKFWEMQALIFENPRKLEDDDLKGYAKQLGLDMDTFEKDFQGDRVAKVLQEDISLAKKISVTGTPTLFLNGKRVRERNFDAMKKEIETLKQKKKGS